MIIQEHTVVYIIPLGVGIVLYYYMHTCSVNIYLFLSSQRCCFLLYCTPYNNIMFFVNNCLPMRKKCLKLYFIKHSYFLDVSTYTAVNLLKTLTVHQDRSVHRVHDVIIIEYRHVWDTRENIAKWN